MIERQLLLVTPPLCHCVLLTVVELDFITTSNLLKKCGEKRGCHHQHLILDKCIKLLLCNVELQVCSNSSTIIYIYRSWKEGVLPTIPPFRPHFFTLDSSFPMSGSASFQQGWF